MKQMCGNALKAEKKGWEWVGWGGGGGGGGVSFSLTNISSFRFSFLVNEGQHFKKWLLP